MATILDQGGDGKVLEEVSGVGKTREVDSRAKVHKDDQPPREHFQSPFSRKKVTQATLSFAVNSSMAKKVIATLTSMGVVNARIEVAKWSDKRFYALANFTEACEDNNLKKAWGNDQINAFLDVLHQKFYSASTLDSQWNAFKKVGHLINKNPTPEQELEFGLVKQDARELGDDCLPVSKKLLEQLCKGADKVLLQYNSVLTKSVFISSWGFSMRISESSEMGQGNKSHNVRSHCVRMSEIGLSIAFESDKTSKYGNLIKHHTISWDKLPNNAREVLETYKKLRPQNTKYFFCKIDRQPLTRNDVINWLDICLLQTEWRKLNITPHSFRQGRASEESLKGSDITDIRHEGRWAHQSKAFDAYARSDLVTIPPSDVYNQYEKHGKKWTSARLKHLLQVVVETPRHEKDHPHAAVLKSQFPSTQKDLRIELPRIYPHTKSALKLAAAKEAREKEIFLKLQEKEQEWHNYISKKRKTLASIRRRETTKRRAIIGPEPAVVIPPANVPAEISREIMTQTYISIADKMCQTTPVRIVEEPLIVDSENKIMETIHPKALVLVPGTSEKVTISLKGRTSSMVRTDGGHQKESRGPSKAAKAKRNIRLKIR